MPPATLKQLLKRMFERPETDLSWYRVIVWWEVRRVAYNMIMFPTGIIGGLIALLLVAVLDPEAELDSVFLSAFAYGFMANICYTGGWIVELLIRPFWRTEADRMGPTLFAYGLIFSVTVTVLGPLLLLMLGLIVRLAS